MIDFLVLAVAGFLAGMLNAVAGGGTFLAFPALVWVGIPPISANASATVASLPGYFAGAFAFRHDILRERRLNLPLMLGIGLAGGLGGSLLLLVTPSKVFSWLVPWLLLASTILFAAGPRLIAALRADAGAVMRPAGAAVIVCAVAAYGGYFNGGLGILLLAAFGLMGLTDLNAMNGLKNAMSAALSVISAVAFSVAGVIAWPQVAVMAAATMAGGYLGGWAARRFIDPALLRIGIVAVGLVMTAVFFWQA